MVILFKVQKIHDNLILLIPYKDMKGDNMKKRIKCLVAIVICTFLFSLTAYAGGTLMTWEGTGIHNKASVQSFDVSKSTDITISSTIHHNTCYPTQPTLYLTLQKKVLLGYDKYKGFTHKDRGSKTFYTTVEKGTYRMYFVTEGSTCTLDKVDITGSVSY